MTFMDWNKSRVTCASQRRFSLGIDERIAHKLVAQFTRQRNPARDLGEGISFAIPRTIRPHAYTRTGYTVRNVRQCSDRSQSDHACRRRPSGSSPRSAPISSEHSRNPYLRPRLLSNRRRSVRQQQRLSQFLFFSLSLSLSLFFSSHQPRKLMLLFSGISALSSQYFVITRVFPGVAVKVASRCAVHP